MPRKNGNGSSRAVPTRTYSKTDQRITPEYRVWSNLKHRAAEIFPEWEKFEGFARDMGFRPSPKHRLMMLDPASGLLDGVEEKDLAVYLAAAHHGKVRLGVRSARYYVMAWSALIMGITILSLKNLGILPHNAFTVWAPQLGSATEITLLSLGLADRIRTLHQAKERAEKALIDTQLTMQDTLLKEVHHRVKNNLQVIASLHNLQSRQERHAQAVEMFKESQTRVQSMALIHERLYQANDAARLDFESYLRTLMGYLFASYGTSNTAIALKFNVDHIAFGVDTAIPCGLIVHELVANALKHAFPSGKPGEIHLDLHAGDNGRYTLRVHDNGKGLPADVDFRRVASLGLKLVNMLTQQLDGVIELQRGGGTTFTITFTQPQNQPRV
jgi:two-component sensor histidine kinase